MCACAASLSPAAPVSIIPTLRKHYVIDITPNTLLQYTYKITYPDSEWAHLIEEKETASEHPLCLSFGVVPKQTPFVCKQSTTGNIETHIDKTKKIIQNSNSEQPMSAFRAKMQTPHCPVCITVAANGS